MDDNLFDKIKFDATGLVPAVVQDVTNNQVLMVAYMNRESLEQTIKTGRATYWSRSRQELWIKGLTSGHVQHVMEVRVDCDADCILLLVDQVGAACHTGYRTCFFRHVGANGALVTTGSPEPNSNDANGANGAS